jgi:hypothetical protein
MESGGCPPASDNLAETTQLCEGKLTGQSARTAEDNTGFHFFVEVECSPTYYVCVRVRAVV